MLLNQFIKHAKKHNFFQNKEETIILAVSGGVDSMVMLHLAMQMSCKLVVAHCNFQLRGEESNAEMEFVQAFCEKYNILFEVVKFDTEVYAKNNKINTQLAARELRYNWFEEIRTKHKASYIATAHNANDQTESLLLNMIRGTGIKGLRGIGVKVENIIRPILFATRTEIEQYAIDNQIGWKNDSSNLSTKYRRNKIRHSIVPLIEKINPNIHQTSLLTAEIMQEQALFNDYFIKNILSKITINDNDAILKINLALLEEYPFKNLILNHLFAKYNFSSEALQNIITANSGTKLINEKFILWKNRELLILISNSGTNTTKETVKVFDNQTIDSEDFTIFIHKIKIQNIDFKKGKNYAWFNLAIENQTIEICNIENGDKIKALGLKGKSKKVSDILIDAKIPQYLKNTIPILKLNNEIIWIPLLCNSIHYPVNETDEFAFELCFNSKN